MYNGDTEGGSGFWMLMVITAVSLAFVTTMILIRNFSGHSASIPKWKRE
jgi:hypothetical protein